MNMPGEKKPNYSKGYGRLLGGAKAAIIALVCVLAVFLVIFFSQKAYSLGYETATYEPVASESEADETEITIAQGMSASDIGKMLIDSGLIDESLEAFLLQDMLSGLHDQYVPGTYTLNNSLTVDEILQIICTQPEEEDDN